MAYLVHLTTAFGLSAFFHCLNLGPVWPNHRPLHDLITNMAVFFLLQPVGIMVEVVVIWLGSSFWNRQTASHIVLPTEPSHRCNIRAYKTFKVITSSALRLLGHVWVTGWLLFTGWPFVRAYLDIGILEWPLPFSILGKIFGP